MSQPDPQPQKLAPPPVAADVGIVMAMPIEAGYLTDALRRVRKYAARGHTIVEGELAGKLVAIVVGGPGRPAARKGADLLCMGHRPRVLVSAGFAGGLDPALARNDLVLPHEICDADGETFGVEPLESVPAGIEHPRGRLLTADRVITTPADKSTLRDRHQADLVDMETAAVASFARDRGIRFLSLRIISDAAGDELPAEVARLLAHTGSYRVGVALRSIWQRPAAIKDFWSLHARAQDSADRLARGLARVLEALPEA